MCMYMHMLLHVHVAKCAVHLRAHTATATCWYDVTFSLCVFSSGAVAQQASDRACVRVASAATARQTRPQTTSVRRPRHYSIIHWFSLFFWCQLFYINFIVLLSLSLQEAKRARRRWCRKAWRWWEIYVDDVIKIMWNFDKISFNCCKTTASNDCDINVQAQTTAIFQFDFMVTCTMSIKL